MHRLFLSSSERVAPGRLYLANLLPVIFVLLTTFLVSSNLLWAQAAPANVQVSYTPSSPLPSGQVATLSATVTTGSGAPVTLGSVTFYEGGIALNSIRVNASGVAKLNYWFPPSSGAYRIAARYNGSAQAGPATSPFVGLAVAQSQSVALASSGSSSSGYTLTATVNTNNSYPPGGEVTFTDTTTGQTLGTANLTGQTWQSPATIPSNYGGQCLVNMGDFNGDGRADWLSDGCNNGLVQIYFTNADGTSSPVTSNAGYVMAVGDFNNDGMTDVVQGDTSANSSNDSLSIWLSQGNGQFTEAGQIPNIEFQDVTVGDFNSDGNLDIMVELFSTGQLEFFAGDGTGNFAPAQIVNFPTNEFAALAADYNNDGSLDAFSAEYANNPYAGTSLFLGTGTGTTFNEQPQSSFGGYPPPAGVASMVNGEFCNTGNIDIAYAESQTVTILCGDGQGNFKPPSNGAQFQYGVGPYVTKLIPVDVNADGYEDIVAIVESGGQDGPEMVSMTVLTNLGGNAGFSLSPGQAIEGSQTDASFPNSPVPFSTPLVGLPFSNLSPYWFQPVFFTSGTTSSGTATLSNVTLPPGNNNIVATYSGTQSNSVQLTGSSGIGSTGPTIANLAPPNGTATVSNGILQLTDGGTWEAGSAWTPSPVDVQAFTTTFTFQLTSAQADGFTFTVQNQSPQALGGNGGMLGYAGIPNSVALKFDLFNNAGEGSDSIGVFTNGANPTVPATDMTASGVDLHSGDVMQAQLIYDGANLHVTVTDTTTNASFTQTYAINIPGTIGSSTALVGFTGATGGLTATQQILSWTYAPLPYYANFNSGPTLLLNGGASIGGSSQNAATLQLIDTSTPNEARSAWFPNPVPIGQFTNDFTFTGSNAAADGITFTIQNASTTALGPSGGGLGYGPDAPGDPVGITNSMAVKFDLYDNAGEGNDSTGIYTNGDSPTVPAIDLSSTGIDLHSSDPIHVHMVYDGSTITMTLTDTVTNATWSHYFYGVNLASLVGASTAYVGFTGGTGGLSATEVIDGWTYLPSNTITSPVSTY